MKIVKGLFIGLLVGLGIGIAIGLFVLCLPILGCTWELACGFLSCDIDCLENAGKTFTACDNNTSSFSFFTTLIYSVILSTVVGIIWGIAVTAREVSENNAIKRDIAEKERIRREQNNKQQVSGQISKALIEFDGLAKSLKQELVFTPYNNTHSTKENIDSLATNRDETKEFMERLINGHNESGGQV